MWWSRKADKAGKLYIRFDGEPGPERLNYKLMRIAYPGYHECIGCYETEAEARAAMEWCRANPPRIIE